MTRLGMAIDLRACIACHACTIACKVNNNLPANTMYNRVQTEGGAYLDTAAGTYPNDIKRLKRPVTCQHCSNPACVAVCPTGASSQNEDGVVTIDTEACIGCKSCIAACPYDVRTVYDDEPTYYVDHALGDWDAPLHVKATADKCTFCSNRRERGEVPACMDLCPGRARYWGDLDDPESDISKFLAENKAARYLEDKGTEPNCFYIMS